MIVLKVYDDDILTIKSECDPPVARNRHGPLSLSVALQWVKEQTRNLQVIRTRRIVEQIEDALQPSDVLRVDAFGLTLAKESLKTFVVETFDHGA